MDLNITLAQFNFCVGNGSQHKHVTSILKHCTSHTQARTHKHRDHIRCNVYKCLHTVHERHTREGRHYSHVHLRVGNCARIRARIAAGKGEVSAGCNTKLAKGSWSKSRGRAKGTGQRTAHDHMHFAIVSHQNQFLGCSHELGRGFSEFHPSVLAGC